MSSPIILIPRQFKGVTLSKLANDITSQHPNGLPGSLTSDFQQLSFIRPAGAALRMAGGMPKLSAAPILCCWTLDSRFTPGDVVPQSTLHGGRRAQHFSQHARVFHGHTQVWIQACDGIFGL